MDLLGSLGTLATNLKNVTLPGVFAALAFALLLWPPHSYDRIPTVKDNHPDIAQLQLFAREFKDDSKKSLGAYRNHSTAACDVHEGAETYTFLTIPSGFSDRAVVAIKNQLILEDIDRTLFKCVEDEQALQGIEDQLTTNVNALIVTRTSERDGINALYQKYILSLSPMRFEFQEKLEKKESEIADLQAHLLNFQRIQRERARRVLQLNRLESEVKLRLGDAGRLRPVQKFDDILSGLSTHVVGFLTLVFAWGLLVDPVNRAVFSFVYDNGFDEEWDSVRPVRQSPGDDAFKKWVPERQADPARTPEGQTQTEAPAGQTERRKGNWLFAAVAGIRSNAWLSLVVVLLSIIAAVLIVLLYEPGSLPPRTSTIIRPSATSVPSGGSITFIATVVAAGSPYVPCGTVKFSEGEDALGSGPLDKESTVEYSVKLPNGTHRITAKYDPSSKENKVPAECEGSPNFQSSSASVAVSFGSKLPPSRAEVPVVPDLSNQQLPQYVRDFSKCVAVTILSLIAGFFLPSVLMSAVHSTAIDRAEKPASDEAIASFKKLVEGHSSTALTCEQKLARDWKKLSQPQYAIGQGLMARSDFEALQNSYYSQSLVSVGLILPLFLLVFALLVTPQLGFGGTLLYLVLGVGELLLLITGVDRRHKYLTELDGLIAGAFLKTCGQSEKKPVSSSSDVTSQISDALKAAKIWHKTDLTIIPGDPPAPSPAPTPGPAQASTPTESDSAESLGSQEAGGPAAQGGPK